MKMLLAYDVGGLAQRQIAAVFGVTPFAVSRVIARDHERPAAGKTHRAAFGAAVLTYRSKEKAETPEGMALDSEHSDLRPSGSSLSVRDWLRLAN
jgi:hypothetical protein